MIFIVLGLLKFQKYVEWKFGCGKSDKLGILKP